MTIWTPLSKGCVCSTLLHEPRELSHLPTTMELGLAPTAVGLSVLGRDEGYTVKYNPLPEGVPEGEARGNS